MAEPRDEHGLRPRERRFADEYLVDLIQRQAAIRAGIPPKSAATQADRLMKNEKVRAYIDRKLAERSRRVGVTADRVLRELARIAFVQAPDVISLDDAAVKSDAGEDDAAAIQSVKVKRVSGEDFDSVEREVKLHDKVKTLELIMRHLGMIEGSKNSTAGLRAGVGAEETGVVVLPEVEAVSSGPPGPQEGDGEVGGGGEPDGA